jgi:hypothetical protein
MDYAVRFFELSLTVMARKYCRIYSENQKNSGCDGDYLRGKFDIYKSQIEHQPHQDEAPVDVPHFKAFMAR